MNKKAFVLSTLFILFIALPLVSSATISVSLNKPDFYVYPDMGTAVLYKGYTHAVDTDLDKYKWVASDRTKIHMFSNGFFVPFANGESYIIGEPLDKTVSRIMIKVVVPEFAYSEDNIVIDSPDGYLFSYSLQPSSGAYSMRYDVTGNAFKVEPAGNLEGYDSIDLLHLIPLKAGKGKLVFNVNGQKLSISVTVSSSAIIGSAVSGDAQSSDLAVCGRVKKSVNIRSLPGTDGDRVGVAGAGELLTVIVPFYTEKWHQILYNGEICYVSANYVDLQ